MTDSIDIKAAITAVLDGQLEPLRYPFPYPLRDGGEVEISVRLLVDEEIDHARIEAQRYCARVKADLVADPDMLEREVQRQLVWRSILEPFKGKDGWVPLFPNDSDVRKLPSTVVEALFRLYLEHQDRVSPMRSTSSADELIDKIAKGGVVALSALDHQSLASVAVALAKRLVAIGSP